MLNKTPKKHSAKQSHRNLRQIKTLHSKQKNKLQIIQPHKLPQEDVADVIFCILYVLYKHFSKRTIVIFFRFVCLVRALILIKGLESWVYSHHLWIVKRISFFLSRCFRLKALLCKNEFYYWFRCWQFTGWFQILFKKRLILFQDKTQ